MCRAEEKNTDAGALLPETARLLDIMERLRRPGGCPWDREQTLETLKPYLTEECGEVLDAIDSGDMGALEEELGDLLLQIVFQCNICEEEGYFRFEDVAARICEKLVRRHPHVFGDIEVSGSDEVLKNWHEIKKTENRQYGRPPSAIEGLPRHLPALMRAFKLQKKAAAVGFDWADEHGAMKKLEEELKEFEEAVIDQDKGRMQEEMGDILFSIVNVARKLKLEPETALQDTVRKFQKRFSALEASLGESGRRPEDCSLEELDAAWEDAKAAEKKVRGDRGG